MSTTTGRPLAQEGPDAPTPSTGPVVCIELIATIALALLTLIAVTAVSIGLARAEATGAPSDSGTATLAIALFIGLLLTGMGGLTAIMTDDRTPPRD
jgi:glycerol uptake facilitator-like aquaporin